MRRARLWALLGAALVFLLLLASASATAATVPVTAAAAPSLDPARARKDSAELLRDKGEFCKHPRRPMSHADRALCAVAREHDLDSCDGFRAACDAELGAPEEAAKKREKGSMPSIGRFLADLGRVAVWVLLAAVIAAILVPIVQALLRRRRDRALADRAPSSKPRAVPAANAVPDVAALLDDDPEALLRRAEEHARAGRLEHALYTYLHAGLRALDARGAIRIAKHRTNGEYVRACKEPGSVGLLRDVVGAVDWVQFGGRAADAELVAHAASRAAAIVRARPAPSLGAALTAGASSTLLFLVFVAALGAGACGCGGGGAGGGRGSSVGAATRPSGTELFVALLERQGVRVTPLGSSLAHLEVPQDVLSTEPALLVDTDRVDLDADAKERLLRWAEAGGVLVVTGAVLGWPERLGVSSSFAPSPLTEVLVRGPVALDDDGRAPPGAAPIVRAHIVDPASLEARAFDAFAVTADDKPYGVELAVGRGHVILLASDDFLTNAQLARPDDAAAMVTAFAHVGRAEIRMATPEDAIAPPDNPIAGLQRAGLGLFTWHALAAALLAFLAVGSRLTRARPTPPPRRRAFAEHVEATGSFYARAGAASHALAVYARYAEERLWTAGRGPAASSFASAPAASASAGRGSGGGGSDPAAILAARGGASPEEAAGLWARAAAVRAGDGPRGDELQVLKRLSALVTRALGGGNGKAP